MATVSILNLPVAVGLDGSEWFPVVQGGTTLRAQTGLILDGGGAETANTVLAGPTSGSPATATFRSLVGADLPNPSASTLGGVQSYAAVSNQFLTSISTSGAPASAQPSAANLSNGTTGSGAVVLATGATITSPSLVTPSLGVATATSISTPTLLITGASSGVVTLQGQNAAGTYSLTLPTSAGSSGQYLTTDGSGVLSWSTASAAGVTVGTSAITGGTTTRVLYDNAGVLGEYAVSGTGNVAMTTSPALSTPTLTTPTLNGTVALGSSPVFNWNGGDITLTYSSNTLAFAGASSVISTDGPFLATTTFTLANATSARGWDVSTRDALTTFPVISFRASTANTVTSMDVMPNGSPAEYGGNGYAWIDVCDRDCLTGNPTPVNSVGMRARAVGNEIGGYNFGGGTLKPFIIHVNGISALVCGGDFNWRFNGGFGVGFVDPLNLPSTSGNDTQWQRESAGVVGYYLTTTPHALRVYNTRTSDVSYERGVFDWTTTANTLTIGTQAGASGGSDRGMALSVPGVQNINLQTGGGTRWQIFGSNGGLYAGADDVYDIGNSASNRPRNIYVTRSILSYGATYGIGYAAGAGGTVAQSTDKTTAFTLNTITGQITLAAGSLSAGATASATWTNSAIAATDVVAFSHKSGGTLGAYSFNAACGAGTCTFSITNISGGALNEQPVIQYVIIKGVSS